MDPAIPTTSPSRAKAPAAKPKAKKAISTTGRVKRTKTKADARTSHGKDLLYLLPPELMALIPGYIETRSPMSALVRTS